MIAPLAISVDCLHCDVLCVRRIGIRRLQGSPWMLAFRVRLKSLDNYTAQVNSGTEQIYVQRMFRWL